MDNVSHFLDDIMLKLLTHKHIQLGCAAFIILAAIGTKWFTINYWAEQGITSVYPWFMPYMFIGWGLALMIRLWTERSRLYSVWIMALALLWYGWQSFAVSG